MILKPNPAWLPLVFLGTILGCQKEDERLAQMAERQTAQQAEQNRTFAKLQEEVAAATHDLVQADARARQEIVELHREVQYERAEFGRQRDALEEDRKQLAAARQRDSLLATALVTLGYLTACMLPLVLCWYLLRHSGEIDSDPQITDALLEDLVSPQPRLLAGTGYSQLEHRPSSSGNQPGEVASDPD